MNRIRNLDGSYGADVEPSRRARSLLTTVALLGAVGAPLSGLDPSRDRGDACPKCKRGKLQGSSARYCHRCGFFVTADIARAQDELDTLHKAVT